MSETARKPDDDVEILHETSIPPKRPLQVLHARMQFSLLRGGPQLRGLDRAQNSDFNVARWCFEPIPFHLAAKIWSRSPNLTVDFLAIH